MQIYPAIDLIGGNVVRLLRGNYDKKTVYSDDPASVAKDFYNMGARNLHVVDLDGAKDGSIANFEVIKSIKSAVPDMFIEVGGGIRDESRIGKYLECGVGRTILGSVAYEDPEFVEKMCKKYGEAIAVGIDASDGFVAIHGWKTVTDERAVDLCLKMENYGVSTVIYTDISRDGALSGTNLARYELLSRLDLNIIASGGITYESEITTLAGYGIYGAILGKALYDGRLDLARCIEIAGGNNAC
ncbi:MAG: 1-(5-phosphoribosyl)-5-[(5-phosphoribosylamino)methylideneamino]imidazole-4-carboxamide isomerase [Clostridia bacterium]|nr:1-(5-phosphoribosyl)-5-[(5-phosphoribosylamino)methylideneamino]imidazole-4-carboxamide isomerase [Clostridia bacterium]